MSTETHGVDYDVWSLEQSVRRLLDADPADLMPEAAALEELERMLAVLVRRATLASRDAA